MNYLAYLCVFLISAIGGTIQTVTGFGMVIIVLLVYPLFYPMVGSAALAAMVCMGNNLIMAYQYRKHIRWKMLWLPVVIYFIVNHIFVEIAARTEVGALKAYFGIFLVLLAIYFLFFSKKIRIKGNHVTGAVSSAASGITGGFFGIGGPLVVPYFLAVAEGSKFVYLGTIQMNFIFQNISAIASRAMNGAITKDILIAVIPGIIGTVIGSWLGSKIVGKINADQLTKIIYFFLAGVGILTFATNI